MAVTTTLAAASVIRPATAIAMPTAANARGRIFLLNGVMGMSSVAAGSFEYVGRAAGCRYNFFRTTLRGSATIAWRNTRHLRNPTTVPGSVPAINFSSLWED